MLRGDVFDESCAFAVQMAQEQGLTFVHPLTIWSKGDRTGTIAMEIIKELPTVDYILKRVPVGGGWAVSRSLSGKSFLNPKIGGDWRRTGRGGLYAGFAESRRSSFHPSRSQRIDCRRHGGKAAGRKTLPIFGKM